MLIGGVSIGDASDFCEVLSIAGLPKKDEGNAAFLLRRQKMAKKLVSKKYLIWLVLALVAFNLFALVYAYDEPYGDIGNKNIMPAHTPPWQNMQTAISDDNIDEPEIDTLIKDLAFDDEDTFFSDSDINSKLTFFSPETALEANSGSDSPEQDSGIFIRVLSVLLRHPFGIVRTAAAEILTKLGSQGIKALIETLGDEDFKVRDTAYVALLGMGKRVTGELIEALGHENEYVRKNVSKILIETEGPLAIFIEALRHKNPRVRATAADELGDTKDPLATWPLKTAVREDPDPQVRANAALGLGRIEDRFIGGITKAERVETLITALLEDLHPLVRGNAALGLGLIGFGEAVEPLIKAVLEDPGHDVRIKATLALGKLGSPRALGPLIKVMFEDKDISMRQAVTSAIHRIFLDGKIPLTSLQIGIRQMENLIELLGDEDAVVRDKIEDLFTRKGDTRDIEYLSEKNPSLANMTEGIRQALNEKFITGREIKEKFGIEVENFAPKELKTISSVLDTFSPELIEGLKGIAWTYVVGGNIMYAGGYLGGSIKTIYLPEVKCQTLFHEIAHFIDEKYFDSKASEKFRTQHSGDFNEDFAYTAAAYAEDSKRELLKAIEMAEKGGPVYLEKILFILDVFTKGHLDYTVVYKINEDNTVISKNISVSRDNAGRIITIGNTSTNDWYGLKRLFSGLEF